jgi:lipopolysaccharide/colanic/teichoic acid biosynthesis glycosyltransferase
MQKQRVQELIVVEPLPPGLESEKLISNCRKAGMRVHLVPQRYELYLSKAKLTEIEDVPLLSLEEQTLSAVGLKLKRIFDFLGAICLLVLSAPLLALSALALRSHKDKVLRKELRCGKNGRPFWMYRLNVNRDAPDLSGCEWILVRFSLTELPQIWNVLKGDMSLVGPRPESPERVKHYSMWQRQRLSVMPGLTGLAQVNGLRENHSSEEKVHFDLQYIFHWSLFLDLSLLLQTIFTLVARMTEGDVPLAVHVGEPTGNAMFGIPKVLNADRT